MNDTYHFIGIGGIGMSGLAHLLLDCNCSVSGSDLTTNDLVEELSSRGANISIGHKDVNLAPPCTVVYSTGIKSDNPEYQKAKDLNLPLLHRADLLWQFAARQCPIAVAGTHGKTTTSALLATALSEGGLDPSFAIGGLLPQFSTNAKLGRGKHFVFEACESDGSFLKYTPAFAIVTNIDCDHMDHYGSEKAVREAFSTFVQKVTHSFWCYDDLELRKLSPKGFSYGFSPNADIVITNFKQQGWHIYFDIAFNGIGFQGSDLYGKVFKDIDLHLAGKHNCLNGCAVFALAIYLGVDESSLRQAFRSFGGVMRRQQEKGSVHDVLFMDDYAHHPSEIITTINGIRRAIGPRRLIVVYQPHRYTRTKYCLKMYEHAFDDADHLFVTDIYAAGEVPIEGLSGQSLLEEISKSTLTTAAFVPKDMLVNHLLPMLQPHDVVLTIGAGDIVAVGEKLLDQFRNQERRKLKIALIFGGSSVEHEISLLSARNVDSALSREHYDVVHFGISKSGKWCSGETATENLVYGSFVELASSEVLSGKILEELLACDVCFPVLHGTYGEDGTIQGFFEILGKPYVGCCYRSSAICMDKAMTKRLMLQHGVPTLPFIAVERHSWIANPKKMCDVIASKIGFPLFIKPAHLGSSIGVNKVICKEQLPHALKHSFRVDTAAIAEKSIDMRELEFAVIGNEIPVAYPPGEIYTQGVIYDFEAKYSNNQFSVTPKADIPPSVVLEGQNIALAAYKAAGCNGMARVDMFYDAKGQFWLNEINPIPGFTQNSLFPMMCEVNGLARQELMQQLIILALQKKRLQKMALL